MDYINIILPVIISIVFAIFFLSSPSLGMLSVLEEDNETTVLGIIWAIVGVAIIIALAIFVYKMSKTNIGENIGPGTSGGIAGLILGELFIVII